MKAHSIHFGVAFTRAEAPEVISSLWLIQLVFFDTRKIYEMHQRHSVFNFVTKRYGTFSLRRIAAFLSYHMLNDPSPKFHLDCETSLRTHSYRTPHMIFLTELKKLQFFLADCNVMCQNFQ